MEIWTGIPILDHLKLISPDIALVVTMLVIMIAPLTVGRSARTIGTIASGGILLALFLLWRQWSGLNAESQSLLSTNTASGMLIVDGVGAFYRLMLLVFLAWVTYMWWAGSSETERDAPEFFILLLGSAVGMALMVSTTNLLMMVIAIEVASLPSYALVGFDKRDRKAAEASLKYMMFGAISAAAMIYGVSLVYGLTGSLEFGIVAQSIFEQFESNPVIVGFALFSVFVGLAFKISAVPFHFWCPDAFEGARIEVTTWLSVASKAAGLILLLRATQALGGAMQAVTAQGLQLNEAVISDANLALRFAEISSVLAPLAWGIGIAACVTCTWANFAAYLQTSIKRLLAYSSVAHAGYMLMLGAIIIHPQNLDSMNGNPGMSALLYYLTIYLLMNLTAFGVVAMIVWRTGDDSVSQFRDLFRRAPLLALPMFMALISLVGLPVFAGFLGKYWILMALGNLGSIDGAAGGGTLGWTLVIVAVFNTLFSLYYYMRIVVEMALKEDKSLGSVSSPFLGTAAINVSALLLVILFIFGQPLKNMTDRISLRMYTPSILEQADAKHIALLTDPILETP